MSLSSRFFYKKVWEPGKLSVQNYSYTQFDKHVMDFDTDGYIKLDMII